MNDRQWRVRSVATGFRRNFLSWAPSTGPSVVVVGSRRRCGSHYRRWSATTVIHGHLLPTRQSPTILLGMDGTGPSHWLYRSLRTTVSGGTCGPLSWNNLRF